MEGQKKENLRLALGKKMVLLNSKVEKLKSPCHQGNNDFMRLVGCYLAEGYVSVSSSKPNSAYLAFTFNQKEKEYIDDVIALLKKIFRISPIKIYGKKMKVFILFLR